MATSQLGKRCKSKREGDIRGLNDTERRGRHRETADEDKGKEEVRLEPCAFSFDLLTVWESVRWKRRHRDSKRRRVDNIQEQTRRGEKRFAGDE